MNEGIPFFFQKALELGVFLPRKKKTNNSDSPDFMNQWLASGGGNSDMIFNFHPENWGKMIPNFDEYFPKGVETAN